MFHLLTIVLETLLTDLSSRSYEENVSNMSVNGRGRKDNIGEQVFEKDERQVEMRKHTPAEKHVATQFSIADF